MYNFTAHAFSNPRFYVLPLDTYCFPECGICHSMGCKNHEARGMAEIQRLVTRARAGGFQAMIFPASFLLHEEAEKILALCQEQQLQGILQIHWKVFIENRTNILLWATKGIHLNLVFDGSEPVDFYKIFPILEKFSSWHCTLAPAVEEKVVGFLGKLPEEIWPNLYFQFTPHISGAASLRVAQVHRLMREITKAFPGLEVRPPLGREVWDPRISPTLALDFDGNPIISYDLPEARPEISVIIPSFNSGPLLKNTLRHLLRQNLDRSRFEIIVVDDGSSDGSRELIQNFMAPEFGQIRFQYLYFPRNSQRRRGDGNFRAGIARNLGVKLARGEILVFLDADIIVPSNYLADLLERHKEWDVIQSIRLHLENERKNALVEYEKVDQEKDTYVLEEKYWGPFFRTPVWESIPFFWKYTCTYALSLKTKDFKEAGWFRKTFVYYGFEDTDLGYRLARMGKKFFLHPMITYHLSCEEDRSEYRQSKIERHLLLSKTAKVFFLNTLDPAIFHHFRAFMGQELSLGDVFKIFFTESQRWLQQSAGLFIHLRRRFSGG